MPEPLVTLRASPEYRSGASPCTRCATCRSRLPPGVLCVVHGRSGSGKTTLLNMIGGLDRPDAGRVLVDGREVSSLGDEQLVEYRRDPSAFVFQTFGLIPILTAAENVEVPLRLRRRRCPERERARPRAPSTSSASATARINGPPELSGGQQQRVAIARALARLAAPPGRRRADRPARLASGAVGDDPAARLVHERDVLASSRPTTR